MLSKLKDSRFFDTVLPFQNENTVFQCLFLFLQNRMYPVDFRIAVLKLYDYFQSMRKTAKAMKVSIASISRWNSSLQPKQRHRKPVKLSDAMVLFVQQNILKNPSRV
jgi:uncharacterized protein YerC